MSSTRETWKSNLGFVLAAAGSAIGLGAIWRLPYTMGQNGGGAFILLFLLLNFVVGVPLFMAELVLGRSGQRGTVSCFRRFAATGSMWVAGGWLAAAAALLILGWYCVVAGWGIHYTLMALVDAFAGKSADQVAQLFHAFRASGLLNVLFQSLFLLLTALIVSRGLAAGIERYSRVMTLGLFAMLLCLVLYGAMLPGFAQAVRYIFVPNWSAITPATVLEALGLALFTLSLGYGPIITYGSYMKPSQNIPQTSLIIGVANFAVSLLIAMAIFPLIFSFGFAPTAGEGLVFQILPFVFEQLPMAMLLCVLFFALLIFTSLTSAISFLEVLVTNCMDLLNWSRQRSVWVGCAAAFVVGLPTALAPSGNLFGLWPDIYGKSFLETSNVVINWLTAFAALITSLFVGWHLPNHIRHEGFCSGSHWGKLYVAWLWCVRVVVPFAVSMILSWHCGLFEPFLRAF
ncbi:MAG: sodium-dependent transporter [Myxococcota bacterium]